MSFVVLCCGSVLLLVALIYLPIFLVRKGFDLVVGCLGNSFIVIVAAILLTIYVMVADVNICQTWLVGEPLCSLFNSIQ